MVFSTMVVEYFCRFVLRKSRPFLKMSISPKPPNLERTLRPPIKGPKGLSVEWREPDRCRVSFVVSDVLTLPTLLVS